MGIVLQDTEPKLVFQFFEEICQIPRCSGNEKAISDYLVNFAKSRNLEVIQDKAMNVIIKKPASTGYENAPAVILQGHMDMVCEKNKETVHDFSKDPIRLRVEGDMLYATNTTLGADNGIAIAYALAILASDDIPHPPLEVVMTVEEETGMGGAMALDFHLLKGKFLINMDSEEEGHLLVSCAGGIRTKQILPIVWQDADKNAVPYVMGIRGLKGGHSGMDIHQGRGNANKLIGRILHDLHSSFMYSIKEINGGSKMNAIPREADSVLLIAPQYISQLENKVKEWNTILKNELRASDPEITVILEKFQEPVTKVFSMETKEKAIASLMLIPNGVQTMSMEIEKLVESSTNLGVVTTTEKEMTFESAIRSSVKTLKYNILNQAKTVAEVLGCTFSADNDYPAWAYDPDSKLRPIFERVYRKKYGKDPQIIAIHAGVECGLFKEKMEDLDMISFGPNMYDVHTPNEHLSISSTQRTYAYLLEVLQEIK